MKSLILGLCLMFLSSVAFAAPYVITDIHNPVLVENYVVTVDGGADVVVAPTVLSDGTGVVCVYDVGGLPDGEHTVTVKAVNLWGSSAPSPFTFTVSLPPTISDIRLIRDLP